VSQQVSEHNIYEKTQALFTNATSNPSSFTTQDIDQLNRLDCKLTEIMLPDEKLCSKKMTVQTAMVI